MLPIKRQQLNLKGLASLALGCSLVTGCADLDLCPAPENKPITVTNEEYKAMTEVLPPQAIKQNGKIVVYQHYLMVSEPKLGIHIFDNTDPSNPIGEAFIKIPDFNTFFVKDDILHVHSHADLVQLDISDLTNIHEVSRATDIFENPNRYRFGWFDVYRFPVDQENEIIIGLERYTEPQEGCGEDA